MKDLLGRVEFGGEEAHHSNTQDGDDLSEMLEVRGDSKRDSREIQRESERARGERLLQ